MESNEFLSKFAQQKGLPFDSTTGMCHGAYKGYHICVRNEKSYRLKISFSVEKEGQGLTTELANTISKSDNILDYTLQGKNFEIETVGGFDIDKGLQTANLAMNEAIEVFIQNGYKSACEYCSNTYDVEAYIVNGSSKHLCDPCFCQLCSSMEGGKAAYKKKTGNILTGIVGALIGSLLGVAAIVIIGQLGYVAAISGVIMAVCTFKGYELLGGKLNVAGIIISSLIMIVMIVAGNNLDWAIFISNAFEGEIDIIFCFRNMNNFIKDGIIESSDYFMNLGMVAVFAIVGAVPTIISAFKNNNVKVDARKVAGTIV